MFFARPRRHLPGTDEAQYKDLTAFFTRWFQTPDGQFLRARHRFETTDEFESQFERLLRAWIAERVPRDKSLIWPLETKGSPFRALLPFDAEHAAIYFGRDRKVTRAIKQIQNVAQSRRSTRSGPRNIPFLLIIGESGSGKSSLMRAGLAPRLTAPGMTPQVDVWRTAVMRVGNNVNPFLTLAKALLVENDDEHGFGAALPELSEQGVRSTDALSELLARKSDQSEKRARPSAVRPIVKTLFSIQANERQRGGFQRRLRANLLILVDQFENIFVSTVSDEHRSISPKFLFSLCATRRVWVAATLRSDFYARLIAPGDFLALKDAGALRFGGAWQVRTSADRRRSAAAAGLVYEMNPETGERLDEGLSRTLKARIRCHFYNLRSTGFSAGARS